MGEERRSDVLSTARTLMGLCPGVPGVFSADNELYREGDKDAPMFSEAWLYTAIGKEDARSVLACLSSLLKAAGVEGGVHDRRLFGEQSEELDESNE